MSQPRKLPALEADSAFFWTSGADGVLRIQRCGDCGHWQHPPLAACPKCHSDGVAPQVVSGRGRVVTYTVNHQAWAGEADPFIFAAIELDEQAGLYVLSNLLAAPGAVATGLRVRVRFEQHEDIWLPLFVPEESELG